MKRTLIYSRLLPLLFLALLFIPISCSKNDASPEVSTVVGGAGKVWMDRNLGATRVAESSTDQAAYGYLYQWGRLADGHQIRTSSTTTTLANSDTPGHGNFITNSVSTLWRNPQKDNLWQGVSGTNNPCPSGFRLPTADEFEAERLTWSSNNSAGAFASPLKLTVAGYRHASDGAITTVGTLGYYWSSTVDGTFSRNLYFSSSAANLNSNNRAHGFSVRCIKD
ncbi:MAG: FISUMP domain-containing protein [Bacteroidales bacterium]|nr:FISUMP domain-containing protein [Bacteroidales bacterium]